MANFSILVPLVLDINASNGSIKLSLNKRTVSNLSGGELRAIFGPNFVGGGDATILAAAATCSKVAKGCGSGVTDCISGTAPQTCRDTGPSVCCGGGTVAA